MSVAREKSDKFVICMSDSGKRVIHKLHSVVYPNSITKGQIMQKTTFSILTAGLLTAFLVGVQATAYAQTQAQPSPAVKPDTKPLTAGDISADGKMIYNGSDWEFAQHAKVLRDGKWVHVDKLSHDNKPILTDKTKVGDVSADGRYTYKGGDAGWELTPHKVVIKDGKAKHVDKLSHNAPTPQAPTAKDLSDAKAQSPGH